MGAAWVTAVFKVLNRGLVTSWLFARAVEHSFGAYLGGVYLRPTLAGIPAFLVGWWIKAHWLPGNKWIEVFGGMGLLAATYYLVAFFVCLEKEHRLIPWRWFNARFRPNAAG